VIVLADLTKPAPPGEVTTPPRPYAPVVGCGGSTRRNGKSNVVKSRKV
jgi:hypothetical protein